MKPCSHRGCGRFTNGAPHLFCFRHWDKVPLPLQKTLTRLWNHAKPLPGFEEAAANAGLQLQDAIRSRRV